MYKQRHYPDNLEIVELDGVVNFQCNHLKMVISPEDCYTYGHLPYVLTSKSLDAARRINMCVGTFSARKNRLVGFACGLSYTMARNVSYLEPLTREFVQIDKYPLFVSLCVDKIYRRQSVGSNLLEIIIARSHNQQFRTLVVDTGRGNDGAHNFLHSHGFQSVKFPLLPDRDIFSLELE